MKLHREEKHTVNIKTISTILTLALTLGLCQTAAPTEAATLQIGTKKLTIKVGKTTTLKLKKTRKKAKWSIASGKKYIRLTAKKKTSVKVKALKEGKAKISCKVGAKKLTCRVVVKGNVKPEKTANPTVNPTNIPTKVPKLSPTQSPAAVTETPLVTATATPTGTPNQTPEVTKIPVRTHEPTENRIMAEPAKYTEVPAEDEKGNPVMPLSEERYYYFFGTSILRKEIEKISIEKYENTPKDILGSFDLSEKQNRSVMAWYTDVDNNGLYEMTIWQEGGVVANPNSSYLFADMSWIKGLDNLYTTGVTNMSHMFYRYRFIEHAVANAKNGCRFLDVGDNFDTSSVTDMSKMFGDIGCVGDDDEKTVIRLGKAFTMENVSFEGYLFMFSMTWSFFNPGCVYVANPEIVDTLKQTLPAPKIIVENEVEFE
ncbi:MAG: BspA family leucine-rich repeat surface protein [Clostridiales bacterium]|nr:BspA family leucine-rich repeat surface protein [Clostridiales bacterium]